MSFLYDLEVTSLSGEPYSLEKHRGEVLLIVNTASKCGFTPQYESLETLYKRYHEQGFTILGFPCNQFGKQEPGSADEIGQFCKINYGVTFPLFEKIDVNGRHTAPLFQWLKKELPGLLGGGIKWNFTKFLIRRDGTPFKRYAPLVEPHKLEMDIIELLQS